MFLDMNPLETVQTELAAAIKERTEIDRKIRALQESAKVLEPIYGHHLSTYTLQSLAGMTNTTNIKDLGITAAVERILMMNDGKWLPPTSIRNGLKEAGFELAGDNPLASIHQVLKRLVSRENSPVVRREDQGQTLYRFDMNRANPYGGVSAYKKADEAEKKI